MSQQFKISLPVGSAAADAALAIGPDLAEAIALLRAEATPPDLR